MNIDKIFKEEDLFPREFVGFEAKEYGILFFDEENKDSYDSNHAVIFKHKTEALDAVLDDVAAFYESKGLKPMLYQATAEEGYFASKIVVKAGRAVLQEKGEENDKA